MNKYVISVICAVLVGCDSGGDSSAGTPQQSAAGIWEGSGITTGNVSGDIVGLIASNGQAVFFTNLPAVVYGASSVSGNAFTFSGLAHDGTTPSSVVMSGTVVTDTSLNVSYASVDESGTFALTKAPASVGTYTRASSLGKLAGSWRDAVTDSAGDWVFTILSSGAFTAVRGSGGCSMSGQFSLIDSSKNEYALSATITSCGSANGAYAGLAFTSDAGSSTDNVISMLVSNSQNGGYFEATLE